MSKTWKESDHPRVKSGKDGGQFTDVPGVEPKKVVKNAAFFAAFSKKIGATDDKATAHVKNAAAAKAAMAAKKKYTGTPAEKAEQAFQSIRQKDGTYRYPDKWREGLTKAETDMVHDKIRASKEAQKTGADKPPAKKADPVKVAGPATLPKQKPESKPTAEEIAQAEASGFSISDEEDEDDSWGRFTEAEARAVELQREMLKGKPWTAAQRAALRAYTGEDYVEINKALRKGGGSQKTRATIQNARKAMRKIPEGVTVFRGMGSGSAFGFPKNKKLTRAMVEGLVGRTWSDPGFTSTATSDGGYGAGQRIRAVITVPAGTRGAFVEEITQNLGENEMVLDAGSHFKITGYDWRGDQVVLKMEVVKQDD